MFSLESFYKILAKNLLEPLNIHSVCFKSFGSTNFDDLIGTINDQYDHYNFENSSSTKTLIFHDQEPIYASNFYNSYLGSNPNYLLFYHQYTCGTFNFYYFTKNFNIIANSEISNEKNDLFRHLQYYDWYYFFHGFAALDWYKNIQYYPPNYDFSNVFICLNNLVTRNRSYRLNLVAQLVKRNLDQFGAISLNQNSLSNQIKDELYHPSSLLSVQAKKDIFNFLYQKNTKKFVVDEFKVEGIQSANDNLTTLTKGFFHVVTETIFYDKKLHLTEKIFKPIVAHRPFILAAAPGNLAYLKKYGFKTFDHWIDESYDNEEDSDIRIKKIVDEIEKLTKLSTHQLKNLYAEMLPVLEYNFNHFYTNFKKIIVDEMIDNFEINLKKFNAGKDASFENYLHYDHVDLNKIKNRLRQ